MKYILISGSSDIGKILIKKISSKNKIISTFFRGSHLKRGNIFNYKLNINNLSEINNFSKLNEIKNWDVIIMLPGTLEPIGKFSNISDDNWVESININFTNQYLLLKKILKYRNIKNKNKSVIFFAGGGINNNVEDKTPYTVSKIAQIKMSEILDNEYDDIKFVSIGPGFVNTKIHKQSLKNKKNSFENYLNTMKRLKRKNVPTKKVVDCIFKIIKSEKKIFGGRNISVENDEWNKNNFLDNLKNDQNIYKLRRNLNNFKYDDLNFNLDQMLNYIYDNKQFHVNGTLFNNFYKQMLKLKMRNLILNKRKIEINNYKINIPFISFGNRSTLDLVSLDELLIFKFYYKKKKYYKNVCDIGCNVGIHSLMMAKLGYRVTAYEPDPLHFKKAKSIFKLNKIDDIQIYNSAVSNFTGTAKMTRILKNTTGNYIGNNKKSYGPTKRISVKVINSKNLKKKFDLIKIDAEGSEYNIIKSFSKNDLKRVDFIMEISTKENREKIWKFIKKLKLNIFSQKNYWKKVNKIDQLPTSHLEGSIFISKDNLF